MADSDSGGDGGGEAAMRRGARGGVNRRRDLTAPR